jgi:hypothetical protein
LASLELRAKTLKRFKDLDEQGMLKSRGELEEAGAGVKAANIRLFNAQQALVNLFPDAAIRARVRRRPPPGRAAVDASRNFPAHALRRGKWRMSPFCSPACTLALCAAASEQPQSWGFRRGRWRWQCFA